jgi:hypothetical protein
MKIVDDAGFAKKTSEMVLVQSKTETADDPAFRAAVADVARTVATQSVVANVTRDAVSKDRHSALVRAAWSACQRPSRARPAPRGARGSSGSGCARCRRS